MTRMTRPDCAVMCNLINTHTHTTKTVVVVKPDIEDSLSSQERSVQRFAACELDCTVYPALNSFQWWVEKQGASSAAFNFFSREMDKSGYTHPFFRQNGGW